jgi:hypothetical protein
MGERMSLILRANSSPEWGHASRRTVTPPNSAFSQRDESAVILCGWGQCCARFCNHKDRHLSLALLGSYDVGLIVFAIFLYPHFDFLRKLLLLAAELEAQADAVERRAESTPPP